jgi:hypothetical protein
MAVAFEGGVVLGADSRTTTGAYIVSRSFARADLELTIPSLARPTA